MVKISAERYDFHVDTPQGTSSMDVLYDSEFGTWEGAVMLRSWGQGKDDAVHSLAVAARSFVAAVESGFEFSHEQDRPPPCVLDVSGALRPPADVMKQLGWLDGPLRVEVRDGTVVLSKEPS